MLLLAVNARRKKIQSFLSSVVRWTCDRYDSHGFDVGSPHASADEEIAYLLGGPFEHVPLSRRSSSYLATICLDLAAVMELGELYNDIRNDFQAVGADPLLIDAGDTMGQYVANSGAIKKESTYAYRENWSPSEPWKVAAHHERYSTNDFYLGRVGRIWELLGISSVVRDRHSVQSWRRIIEAWNI